MPTASPQPLYQSVYRMIADQVSSGQLRPGDRLPAERTLCAELGVSRATVRRAFAELVQDGIVEASVGRGSFVAGVQLTEPPNVLLSFTSLGAKRGLEAGARVLDQIVERATLDTAEAFEVAPGAPIFLLRRLRLLDGLPVAVDEARVPLALAPQLPDLDFAHESLYAALDEAGSAPVRADYAVEAAPASAADAPLLDLEPGEPVLVSATTAYTAGNRVVERTRTVYRGDRYRFRATLARRPAA